MSDEKPLANGESATEDEESPGGVLGIRITSRMGTMPAEVDPAPNDVKPVAAGKPVVSRDTAPLGRDGVGGIGVADGGAQGVSGGTQDGSVGRYDGSVGRHDEGAVTHDEGAVTHDERAVTLDAKTATLDAGTVTREMKVVAHDARAATYEAGAATDDVKRGSDVAKAATDDGGTDRPDVKGGAHDAKAATHAVGPVTDDVKGGSHDAGTVTREMKVVAHDTEPSGRVTKPLFRPESAPPAPAKPWSGVTTEPLPMPADRLASLLSSPDSSGSLTVDGGPKKIAEIKRSPAVESMLDGFGYARPHVTMQRAETDGDLYAAHASGPRPVPAAVLTPTLEPALLLSQSLVEAIRNPTPSPPLVAPADVAPRSPRPDTKTVILPRTRYRQLTIAFVPCALVMVALVWIFTHGTARSSRSSVIASPAGAVSSAIVSSAPVATATHAPLDLPPVPSIESVTPPVARAPAAAAPPPTPAPTSPRTEHSAPVAHPGPSPKHPAPAASNKNDVSSLHTDLEVQN